MVCVWPILDVDWFTVVIRRLCLATDLQKEKEDAVSDPLLDMSKMDDVAPGEVSATAPEIL